MTVDWQPEGSGATGVDKHARPGVQTPGFKPRCASPQLCVTLSSWPSLRVRVLVCKMSDLLRGVTVGSGCINPHLLFKNVLRDGYLLFLNYRGRWWCRSCSLSSSTSFQDLGLFLQEPTSWGVGWVPTTPPEIG